ncbi:MAG TPA: rRNA adenine N-6-methyltransferase family protein [Acetobacteraceae bacterium]
MNEDQMSELRRAFARSVLASVEGSNARLEDAFAHVRREQFLGPGPWQIIGASGYEPTPDADPSHLYADVLVGIIPERRLNNGMPSYHAPIMAHAAVQTGEHVVHIGAGVGYYTAILANLVGPSGQVTAIEFDVDLAQRAAQNLSDLPNVAVLQGDGFTMPFALADVIYVNAGTTGPATAWLDNLKDGGRLLLPITARKFTQPKDQTPLSRHGAVFLITRNSEAFEAKWISAVGVFPCEGGRDDEAELTIDMALHTGGFRDVKRLYRRGGLPADQCWLQLPTWSLAYG